MRLYILGIGGTFMGGLARLACEGGHQVGGTDAGIYPPMSTQLETLGIDLHEGYEPDLLEAWQPDLVVIGNALSRGNPMVEHILNREYRYISGPQWLSEQVLANRWVLAVAGTHGKTTTSSLLCWLLEEAGCAPGFLIGGVPENFGVSARMGQSPYFVIEADEYDTAFFDKRSKFVHYQPKTLVLNNLEFDHADIFDDIADIKRQFHHLIRVVPGEGLILVNADDSVLKEVMAQGCWSQREGFSIAGNTDWTAQSRNEECSSFDVCRDGQVEGRVDSSLIGSFNMSNTLAAIAAAHHAGVPVASACRSVSGFRSVKRRLELLATVNGIRIYDDFAHHPTAIAQTLKALRQRAGSERIICVLEPRSNTMLLGRHQENLQESFHDADQVALFKPEGVTWDMEGIANEKTTVFSSVAGIIQTLVDSLHKGDEVVIMSNGSFDNIHQKLIAALSVTISQS